MRYQVKPGASVWRHGEHLTAGAVVELDQENPRDLVWLDYFFEHVQPAPEPGRGSTYQDRAMRHSNR